MYLIMKLYFVLSALVPLMALLIWLISCDTDEMLRPKGLFKFVWDRPLNRSTLPRGSMMDAFVRALDPMGWKTGTFDLFAFLRDSYPLPGGLKSPWKEYDYIVVGAGSAGCAVSSRLSEDRDVTVLVLEAGRPEVILTDAPALAPYFQRTDYAGIYENDPQPGVCQGMLNRRCIWPRGIAVGGSSVINYMAYTRGRPEDWDRIAADGNYGWSYRDVLPYYIKMERSNLLQNNDSPYKGHSGKVSIENPPFRTRLVQAFFDAGKALGIPFVDYNDPGPPGFGYVQGTTARGHRFSSAKAYLHPHRNRKNLHVLTESRATKINIDKNTRTAVGVDFVRYGIKYTVKARREVIVSAGTIESPKLLMLSGIGPVNHLKRLNISVIQNLNVGRTLYDHVSFDGIVFTLNTTISLIEARESNLPNVIRWLQFGDGPISSLGGIEGIGFIKTEVSYEPDVLADIELMSLAGSWGSDGGGAVRKGMRIRDDVFLPAYGAIINQETWSSFPVLIYPKSKGFLELRDTNPFTPPRIVNNYLTHPRDVQTLLGGIRFIIKLANTPAFQKYGAKLYNPDFPECRHLEFNTDDFWECCMRQITTTEHHQIASCKMGPPSDPDAVVDPELRVYGVNNLRVVDCSIIPKHISGHTNGPAMMIGEKAAEMIKWTWS